MAAKQGSGGARGGTGKVPPRPGGRPAAPARPSSRGARPNSYAGGRPAAKAAPRASARQVTQRRRQRNIYMAMGGSALVIVVIAVLVTLQLAGSNGSPKTPKATTNAGTFALDPKLVSQVENVPVSKLVAAAIEAARSGSSLEAEPPQKLPAKNPLLTDPGKPEFVYMGGEYCPYCAAERWALIMAFAKFGTFANLVGTTSSATDTLPSTPTFSFYGSSYTSQYISFMTDELYKNSGENSSGVYPTLQPPNALEEALITKWDAPPYVPSSADSGGIPFIYLAGRFVIVGPQYVATPLSGMQWDAAESYMVSGNNVTSKEAMASAGYLLGDICSITNGKPASVCSQVPKELWGISTSSSKLKAPESVPSTTSTTKAK